MKKVKLISIFLVIVTLISSLAAGCGCNSDVEETTPEVSTEETTAADTLPEGYMYSYLTGLPVKKEIGMLRPVGYQIDNEKKALPQCGISKADIIYEVPIEANEVRLTAIFQDLNDVGRIGPLRSARSYHPGILAEFNGIFFHNGHSKYALPILNDENCDDIEAVDRDYEAKFHTNDHKSGHNDFTNQELTEKYITKYKFNRTLSSDFAYKFKFAKEENILANGITCNKLSPNYTQNKPVFEYNASEKVYYRSAHGGKHIDENNNEQIKVKNIIVEYCHYNLEDDKSNKDIHTVGTGEGLFVTNGKAVNITWEKKDYWGNTHYYYENGQEIELNPGKTWVCIALPSMTGQATVE